MSSGSKHNGSKDEDGSIGDGDNRGDANNDSGDSGGYGDTNDKGWGGGDTVVVGFRVR